LAAGMADIERRVVELEAALKASQHPRSDVVDDLSKTQHMEMETALAALRRALFQCAEDHEVTLDRRSTNLSWLLQSGLAMLRVAVDDLGARRMRGYGPLDDSAVEELKQIQTSIDGSVDALLALVARLRSA